MAPSAKFNINEYKDDVNATGNLDLSASQLHEVPVKDIIRLKKVTKLNLSSNKLVSLGANFTTLTQLTSLNLSNNALKELPDNIGQLKNLRHLDLSNNKLKTLPVSLANLKQLRTLDLKNNPLQPALQKAAGTCANEQQCQQCAKRVLALLLEQQASAPAPQASPKAQDASDDKKVKGKNAKVTTTQLSNKNNTNNKQASVKTNDAKKKQVDSKSKRGQKRHASNKTSWTWRLFSFLTIALALIVTGVFLAQKFPAQYDAVRSVVARQTQAAVSLLPPHVQEYVYVASEHVASASAHTYAFVRAKAIKLNELRAHPSFKAAEARFVQLLHDLTAKVKDVYKQAFEKQPDSSKAS